MRLGQQMELVEKNVSCVKAVGVGVGDILSYSMVIGRAMSCGSNCSVTSLPCSVT